MATVSVVIPCYNGAKYLPETLRSALAQTRPALEVIVVDDGSTDDSAAVAAAFGPPVRVVRQPNRGESVARNRGVDEARGEWVAFLDADDLWLPEKLERQAGRMTGGVVGVCTGHRFYRPGGDGAFRPEGEVVPPPGRFETAWILRHGAPCQVASLAVRRDLPVRFPEWTRYGEDALYFAELVRAGPVAVVEEPLVYYRRAAGSQSRRPDIEYHWCRSAVEWIDRRAGLAPGEASEYRRAVMGQVGDAARSLIHARDWTTLAALQDFLRGRPDLPDRDPVLRLPGYPRWAYWVRDRLGRRAPPRPG